jgi:pimeloyl-ACP methyl ester carboxylesterase
MTENHPEVLHGDFLACDRFDVLDRLGEIKVPTQVICGVDDMLTPLKYSRFLVEAIPEANLVAIDDAGHMVMLERPGDVARVVKEFMGKFSG